MKLYVYRINDHEYGAGLGRRGCQKLGTIVEEWPLDSPEQAKFLSKHGTSYHGASTQVTRIADLAHNLLVLDKTIAADSEPIMELNSTVEPKAKPRLLQRITSWFYAR